MKKTLLIAAAALMLCIGAHAQTDSKSGNSEQRQKPDATQMAQNRTDRMVKKYGLNDTQAADLLTLNKKYAGKMGPGAGRPGENKSSESETTSAKTSKSRKASKSGKASTTTSSSNERSGRPELTDAQKKEMQTNRSEYEAELKKILTDEQYKSYQEDSKKGPMGGQHGDKSSSKSEKAAE